MIIIKYPKINIPSQLLFRVLLTIHKIFLPIYNNKRIINTNAYNSTIYNIFKYQVHIHIHIYI